jgi:hypothetical protein
MVKEASEEAVRVAALVGYINIEPLGLCTVTGDRNRLIQLLECSCDIVLGTTHLID